MIKDIKTLLTGISSSIFLSELPDVPDCCVALYESGGFDDDLAFDNTLLFENPTFQVIVRDNSYETGYGICQDIKDALNMYSGEINGNTYISVFCQGNINGLGKDDRGRSEFSINFIYRLKR